MTEKQAIARARKLAKKANEERYIVYDPDPCLADIGYHVATDFDLDTWYLGLEPIAVAWPSGELDICR